MARPTQESIDSFITITGASHALALRRLQEHDGDLNGAINAHFNYGDDSSLLHVPVAEPEPDFMAIDDPPLTDTARFFQSSLSAPHNLNPFSIFEQSFGRSFFGADHRANLSERPPIVTHPPEVREIPIELKGGTSFSNQSGSFPIIEEVTGSSFIHEPEIHGRVVIEDDDEDPSVGGNINQNELNNDLDDRFPEPSAPQLNVHPDDDNEIEEEMLRAAIEASKNEADARFSSQYIEESSSSLFGPHSAVDAEMAHAVSLSLKKAELEKAAREGKIFEQPIDHAPTLADAQEPEKSSLANGRKNWDVGSSSFLHEEADDEDDEPLVRNASKRAVAPGSVEPAGEDRLSVVSVASSPESDQDFNTEPVSISNPFHSDELAGITSEEQEEAFMLEAAMFGVMPENSAYGFRYPRRTAQYRMPDRRPPSPTLTAQRLLREQQDDEYLASLQADREKELKAKEDAKAALAQEKHEEEEARRKLVEKEEFEQLLARKEALLPEEPSSDDENAVTLLIRMPDGSRLGRRFRKCDKLQALFDFIDVARVVKPGTYNLVRPFPRRAYSSVESELSLSDLGLSSKQEALFLESI